MKWITSDTHYKHFNIASLQSSWKRGFRNFKSLGEHDYHIINMINKYVKEDDELYHLGDWSFGGIENIWDFRKRINCKNIHLFLGNHDEHIKKNKVLPNVLKEKGTKGIFIEPGTVGSNHDRIEEVTAKELFSSVNHVGYIVEGDNRIFCSHYSHRVWDQSHKGSLHCYGHSHGSIPGWGKSMDVGVDVAYKLTGEYRPFSLEEVIKILNSKEISIVDHHESRK